MISLLFLFLFDCERAIQLTHTPPWPLPILSATVGGLYLDPAGRPAAPAGGRDETNNPKGQFLFSEYCNQEYHHTFP